jgi:hypothetical protein
VQCLGGQKCPPYAVRLDNLFAYRNLPRNEKSLDQLALTTNHHSRELLEPLARGHLWVSVHPPQHQPQLLP